ncbi:protein phosphatase 2C domain-containing protein [Streptomyces sp. NBC_00203]|uniref:protein phosphatase 2C domain-containing protein n=1 Tax=Streptomyces sp. NBC_00203 TaxID=2975680 RepID=UPI0032471455
MSQQGEKPTGHEDDWWGQLYDDSTEDTGPAAVADSLDDRFASAAGTMGLGPAPGSAPGQAAGPGSVRRPDAPEPEPDVPPPPERPPAVKDSTPARPEQPPAVPEQRGGLTRRLAPWEPPPDRPPAPATFPPGPTPPGFRTQEPRSGTPQEPLSRTPSPESPVAAVPASRAPVDVPPAPVPPPAAAPGDTLPITPSDARPPQPAVTPQDTAPPARQDAPPSAPEAVPPRHSTLSVAHQPPAVDYVGSGPPTYDAEPTALPPADPDDLDDLVADTVLDGARYGTSTLRAVSVRGDSARYRGEPRRDSLLTARFGTGEQALVLVAMATGARATPDAHRAAAEACQWIGRAVGRSHARLAEDIRAARRGDLKSGLHRLTDRSLGKLRATAAEQGIEPEEYTASLRCLLLPADPECRTRVFFGVGTGGLFRLRDGEWQDIEPRAAEATGEAVVGFGSLPHETPEGDRLTMDLGITTPPSPYEPAPEPPRDPFRFRASVARPGDTLLLCTGGLADPLRGEPELAGHLTTRWSAGEPPGLAAFLADTLVRVKGYADDRTAAAVWEA